MTPNRPLKFYRHPLSGHSHRVQLALSLVGLQHELIETQRGPLTMEHLKRCCPSTTTSSTSAALAASCRRSTTVCARWACATSASMPRPSAPYHCAAAAMA